MNSWLSPDWDRGYKAGRKEGLKELRLEAIKSLKKHLRTHKHDNAEEIIMQVAEDLALIISKQG